MMGRDCGRCEAPVRHQDHCPRCALDQGHCPRCCPRLRCVDRGQDGGTPRRGLPCLHCKAKRRHGIGTSSGSGPPSCSLARSKSARQRRPRRQRRGQCISRRTTLTQFSRACWPVGFGMLELQDSTGSAKGAHEDRSSPHRWLIT
jgi:hypothetical protein